MADGLLPPYGDPSGPLATEEEVLRGFCRGLPVGYSERFHVEDRTLVGARYLDDVVLRDAAVAIWLGPGAVLVRVDIASDMVPAKEAVESALTAEGMTKVDEETLLAAPVALQILALRQSSWDLWGSDMETAFFTLRAMAGGDELRPIMEQGPGDFPV